MQSIWEYLNPLDVDEIARSFREAHPFPHFVVDDLFKADFLERLIAAYPSYAQAQALGREFGAANERVKVQITDSARFPDPIRELNELLAGPEFLELMSRITGIPKLVSDERLVGAGMHMMGAGGRLDVHVDFNRLRDRELYRRLNILVFLNERWSEEWGGCLDLWDRDVKQRAGYFVPIANRCVVFETSDISFHGVTPLRCPDGVTRNSFAAYYYTQDPPPTGVGQTHSTIFRPRPDEWQRWLFAVRGERLARSTRSALRRLKNGLFGRSR